MLQRPTHVDSTTDCDGPGVDLALVRAVIAGEERASEALLQRLRCLSRFVAALNQRSGGLFDAHELSDLIQDTLVVVWRKLERFHGPDGLESWVLRIARYEYLNALRKRSRRGRESLSLESAEQVEGGADHAQAVVDGQSLTQVLAELEPATEQTIRLKHFAGLTFEEIGERMACSSNTAKTRYYRGLARLADALDGGESR